jgi:hypothetical protein
METNHYSVHEDLFPTGKVVKAMLDREVLVNKVSSDEFIRSTTAVEEFIFVSPGES